MRNRFNEQLLPPRIEKSTFAEICRGGEGATITFLEAMLASSEGLLDQNDPVAITMSGPDVARNLLVHIDDFWCHWGGILRHRKVAYHLTVPQNTTWALLEVSNANWNWLLVSSGKSYEGYCLQIRKAHCIKVICIPPFPSVVKRVLCTRVWLETT